MGGEEVLLANVFFRLSGLPDSDALDICAPTRTEIRFRCNEIHEVACGREQKQGWPFLF